MKALLRLLSLRRSEVPRISLAALIFFLVALNDAVVKSVSAGVFNIRAGVDRLPEMYTWIAWLFALTMVLLSCLTTKVRRERLIFGLLGVMATVLALNTVLLWMDQAGAGADLAGTGFYPFLFISSEIVRSMANFQIWIIAGGICFTSRAKVLFPLLAASTTLGDIAGGFLIGLLGVHLASHETYALTVVSAIFVILLLRPLMRRYFVSATSDGGESKAASLGENLRYFAGSSYLRLLFMLSLALFALYTAIHYGFNVVARQHYSSEGDIIAFFGLFFGVAGVATLVVTTLALRRVLRWLGVGSLYMWVCAVHLAIALVLLSVFQGVLPVSIVAVIFICNILNYVLLDSIIAPTYQVLIKLVPSRNSDGTRMIMEGGFMLLGGLLGAGVTALHARGVVTLGEFFTLLAVIAAAMVATGWRLRSSYTEVLIKAVQERNVAFDDEEAMQSLNEVIAHSADFSQSLLLHREDSVREMGIEILRKSADAAVPICLPLIAHENPRIRSAALDAMGGVTMASTQLEVISQSLPLLDDVDTEVQQSAALLVARAVETAYLNTEQPSIDAPLRQQIIDAVSPRLVSAAENAALLAQFLFVLHRLDDAGSMTVRTIMVEQLLESESAEEITAGIAAAARMGTAAGYPQIVDFLSHPLAAVRESAVGSLHGMSDEGVLDTLLELLGDPDPDVVDAAVSGLRSSVGASRGDPLVQALRERPLPHWERLVSALLDQEDEALIPEVVQSCSGRLREANGYLVAAHVIRRQFPGQASDLLAEQLQLQCRAAQNGTIRVLGHLGDVGLVNSLLDRLNEEDEAARENAIELLENIGDSALMQLLLPLMSDDDEEGTAAASANVDWPGSSQLSIDTALNFALGSSDRWTRMASAWVATTNDRRDLLEGLPDEVDEPLTQMMNHRTDVKRSDVNRPDVKRSDAGQPGVDVDMEKDQPLTSMERITFLKASPFFAALPLEELYHIALSVQEESVKEGTAVIRQGTLGDKMYIVVEGELQVRRFDKEEEADGDVGDADQPDAHLAKGQLMATMRDKQVFGDMALLDDEPRSASVVAVRDCHLLSLQRGDLERILRRYSSIAFNMMRILSSRLRESMAD